MYTTNFGMGNMMRKAVEMDDFGGPPNLWKPWNDQSMVDILCFFLQINLYSPLFAGSVILITLR